MTKQLLLAATLPLLLGGGCAPPEKKPSYAAPGGAATQSGPWHFRRLPKLFIIGNFDGDQRPDTVYQHTFSGLTGQEQNNGPDPLHHDWEAVVQWLTQQRAEVALTLNKPARDTLCLGLGQGLYCLLNLGDTNADGRDELAIVVDRADFSQLNSCRIVSYCQGSWKTLKQFSINETAFELSTDSASPVKEIDGFLLKQGPKWLYTDYAQAMEAEDDGEHLQELRLAKCR